MMMHELANFEFIKSAQLKHQKLSFGDVYYQIDGTERLVINPTG
jgi:hypothetical protein